MTRQPFIYFQVSMEIEKTVIFPIAAKHTPTYVKLSSTLFPRQAIFFESRRTRHYITTLVLLLTQCGIHQQRVLMSSVGLAGLPSNSRRAVSTLYKYVRHCGEGVFFTWYIIPFFLPVDTQHNQCPRRFFYPRGIQVIWSQN